MGVLAQGPLLTPPWCLSFPQAGLSPAGDSAVLVLPPPPSPGRRSSSPRLRYQGSSGRAGIWEGLGVAGDCQASRRRVGGSQLSKPGWLPFDPQNPLSCPGTLFLCPSAPPDPQARAPHSCWFPPSPQCGLRRGKPRPQRGLRSLQDAAGEPRGTRGPPAVQLLPAPAGSPRS